MWWHESDRDLVALGRSLDKQFTAVLILWLRERGKLTVEDPVRNHLPGCPERWREVTIRHLLGHTSGISNLTELPDYFEKRALPSFAPQALARIGEMPLRFRPGERFEYSNTNYELLHQIAERVSGRPFASLLQEVVLDPLKMADTGSYVRPGIRHLIVKRGASGYTDGRGPLEGAPWVYPFGMYSTVEDLLRWDQALARGTLLPKTALEAAFTRGPGGYGLGWFVGNRSGHRVLTHGGNTPGFGLTFTRYPDDQVTIIVASNLDTAPAARIADDLAAMVVFGEEIRPPRRRKTIVVDPRSFDAYVGRYRHTKDRSWVITIPQEEGQLWNRLSDTPGWTEMVLRPLSETRFFNPEKPGGSSRPPGCRGPLGPGRIREDRIKGPIRGRYPGRWARSCRQERPTHATVLGRAEGCEANQTSVSNSSSRAAGWGRN